MQGQFGSDGHVRSDRAQVREDWKKQDGFLAAAVHSMTHTVPRGGFRARLVPWTLALVMVAGLGGGAIGLVTATYWLLGVGVGVVVVAGLYGAIMHSWRTSTRYKRPLDAPAGPWPPDCGDH